MGTISSLYSRSSATDAKLYKKLYKTLQNFPNLTKKINRKWMKYSYGYSK